MSNFDFNYQQILQDTDDLLQGTVNLYYSETLVDNNSNVSQNTTHRQTIGNPHDTTLSDLGLNSTDNLLQGVINLYYSDTLVDSNTNVSQNTTHRETTGNPHATTPPDIGINSTDDIMEGTNNWYFTQSRVSSNSNVTVNTAHSATVGNPHLTTPSDIGLNSTDNLLQGSINFYYSDTLVNANSNVSQNTTHRQTIGNPHGLTPADLNLSDTDGLPEGITNYYYTDTRVTNNTSVTQNTNHRLNTSNPHNTTPSQIGINSTDNILEGSINLYYSDTLVDNNANVSSNTAHRQNMSNPHNVSPSQLGLNSTDDLVQGSVNYYYSDVLVSANVNVSANTAHTLNMSNPHNVSPSQVGNTIAQWNSDRLQNILINSAAPINGQALIYNSASLEWEPSSNIGDVLNASNLGTGGVGVFINKTSQTLNFRNINAANNTIGVVLDGANNNIDLNVNVGNILINNLSGVLNITKGGTGQTTAISSFNALSPAINKGSLITNNSITNLEFPVGTDGQILQANSATATGLEWTTNGNGSINTASNVGASGFGFFKQVVGDNLEFLNINSGSNKITIALNNPNNEIEIDVDESNLDIANMIGILDITHGGTNASTKTIGFNNLSPLTSKGDLITFDLLHNVRLGAGANGQVLSANSVTITGLEWIDPTLGTVTNGLNVGNGGVGVFDSENSGILEFRNINAGSNKISVSLDVANKEIDIDAVESNFSLNNISGTLSISKGGTGETTTNAAFDALAPTLSKGDIIVMNSTTNNRLVVGSDFKVLMADSAESLGVKWNDAILNALNVGSGGISIISSIASSVLNLKSINAGSNKISVADDGGNNEIDIDINEGNLTLDNIGGTLGIFKGGTGQSTQTNAFNALSPNTTKGDIIINNGANDVRFPSGSDTEILSADSASAEGVIWIPNINNKSAGEMYFQNNLTPTVIGVINTPVKIVGTYQSGVLARFNQSLGTLTYTGPGENLKISYAVDFSSPNTNNIFCFYVSINGLVLSKGFFCTDVDNNDVPVNVSGNLIYSFVTNDTVELWVENQVSTDNPTIINFNMSLT